MDEGLAAQQAAQVAFTARQTAMSVGDATSTALEAADATARQSYTDFRETGRTVADASDGAAGKAAARIALGLNGKVPANRQTFLPLARTSYAAQQAPYAASFATYGYSETALNALVVSLDALEQAIRARDAAEAAAKEATRQRDGAFTALKAWLTSFKRIARVALRQSPDLLAKLGL